MQLLRVISTLKKTNKEQIIFNFNEQQQRIASVEKALLWIDEFMLLMGPPVQLASSGRPLQSAPHDLQNILFFNSK